ncbi:MAG: hypothetical protein JF888_09490 [Candidatus Dormibacteraeota bacterium]|uniref:Diadenosine tetraphosphate hydrolase n=2 Tax=Candidatus Dormiibacter inghamiae TaxID=3127013 RepID=A0A934KDD6_9BACT|nr:hypothetical protein [Candidatus Dormibacteraeota bacterium]MBJ7606777.1 hypothetical protein [Candidatus Dormibacteraeota bacterium]
MCEMEGAAEEVVIFRDELWACEILPGYEVPGWVVLRARRHAVGWTGLDEAELNSFGHRARAVDGALKRVTHAPATYVMIFGEAYPHFHALMVARGVDVPPERRTGDILKLRAEWADPARAHQLLPGLRAAYTDLAQAGDLDTIPTHWRSQR